MIRVYFESSNHAELVAIFDDEETFDKCRAILAGVAREARMKLTESIDESNIDDYEKES